MGEVQCLQGSWGGRLVQARFGHSPGAQLGNGGRRKGCGGSLGDEMAPGSRSGECFSGLAGARQTPPLKPSRHTTGRSETRYFRSLNIRGALLQAAGFCREVLLRAPMKRGAKRHPLYFEVARTGLSVECCASGCHKTRQRFRLRAENSLVLLGLKLQVSQFDPCLHLVFRASGGRSGRPRHTS